MARLGNFGLERQDPRCEEQAAWTRWGRIAGLGAVAGVAVLAAGVLGLPGAHASDATLTASPNPVHVTGGETSGTTVLSWDTGDGTSGTVYVDHGSGKRVFATGITGETTAKVLCDKTNDFTLEDTASSAVLATLSVGVTGCSAPSPSPSASPSSTPKPSPSASPTPKSSPKPLPDPLMLTPSFSTTSTEYYWDESNAFYCLIATGLDGYGAAMPVGKVQVGYTHYDDPGTQPFPCWLWQDSVSRAAIGFDWDKVNSYVKDHGYKSMAVHFSSDSSSNCTSMVMINDDPGSQSLPNPYDGLLPGGFPAPGQPQVDGSGFKMDETGWLVLADLPDGAGTPWAINADSHFVFMGYDESLSDQDNNSCLSTLHDFTLTLTPDH